MYCPFCHALDTKVIDSRLALEGSQVKRRRLCPVCDERFTTFETIEWVMPHIIKKDGSRVAFDERKLRGGMLMSLQKRPVSMELIDQAVLKIMTKIRELAEKEIQASLIGEFVMHELALLDQVAYVRFASVYRQFQDVSEFESEIQKVRAQKV